MATAPDYGGQKVGLEPLPRERFNTEAPPEAFGGGAPAAQAGAATREAFGTVEDIAAKGWDRANQLAVLDADNQMNEVEAKLKTAAFSKHGKDAFGLPEQVMSDFDKQAGDVANGLSNVAQQMSFAHVVNSRRFMLERTVGMHVDGEIKAYDSQQMNAGLDNAREQAIQNYSWAVSREPIEQHDFQSLIDKQKGILTDYAGRNGIPLDSDLYKSMERQTVSATHAGVIRQFAENGLSEVGQEYLKAHADDLTDKDSEAAKNMIRVRLPQDVASRLYENPPRLEDGSPDRGEVKAKIDADGKLDGAQKEAAFNAFEAFANHDATALKRDNDARSSKFFSDATDAINKGASPDALKKLADGATAMLPNESTDEFDRSQKYDFIEQMQKADDHKNDPETLIAIHDGMNDGSITTTGPILAAMKAGTLSRSTAANLAVQLNAGKSMAMAERWKILDSAAESEIPYKPDRDAFRASLRVQATEQKITDPTKLQELYDENMKPVKESAWFGWQSHPAYEAQETAHKNPELVRALGGGKAIIELAQKMGASPDAFDVGKPYANAALWLHSRGKAVSPENVAKFIEKYPEYKP